ncbi:MAG: hypothetical protein FWD95_08005 [Nocardioidaceae bacterium]|nr:hypothetical protein [Nocardioidaceae bacterium]
MMGHLGPRVSALLDGQLSQQEADEAWAHVYGCTTCRGLVEREGWIKTRLARTGEHDVPASSDLKGSLLNLTPGDCFLAPAGGRTQRHIGVGAAVVGGGAVGVALLGVLALGLAPGSGGARPPVSQIGSSVPSPASDPAADRVGPRGARPTTPADLPGLVQVVVHRLP